MATGRHRAPGRAARARRWLLTEPGRPAAVRDSPRAPWLAVAAVCAGSFMGQLDASMVYSYGFVISAAGSALCVLALFLPATAALLLAISAAAGLLLAAFVRQERRAAAPMLDPGLLRPAAGGDRGSGRPDRRRAQARPPGRDLVRAPAGGGSGAARGRAAWKDDRGSPGRARRIAG